MPVVPSSSERRPSNVSKTPSRSNRTQRARTSKSVHISHSSQQTSSSTRPKKIVEEMTTTTITTMNLLAPPRPADPTLFIRAGTSGVRHLLPIHLTESDCHSNLFSRPISRLRSHTPTTESCTKIEMIRNICRSISTLEHFDVSENDLGDLPLDICLLIHLETFNCSQNHLKTIPDLFEQLKQLKCLDMSFNQFKRLPKVIYSFKHLIRLNCEHNSIKKIEPDLLNLKHLKVFVLDHNQLQSFDTLDFSQLKKLEYFHAAHNQLVTFPSNLHRLTHLKNLNLSHNQLRAFPIELLLINTLDAVNLSHNLITKLPPLTDLYKRTSLIFSIDLSSNQLKKFYEYLLLISIKVDLSNNQIQSIPKDFIRNLTDDMIGNRELKIANNPLTKPIILSEVVQENKAKPINILQIIRTHFDDQENHDTVRQGFRICITGCKRSGKTSLAYCLEDYMPLIPEEKTDRLFNILQFPFHFDSSSRKLSDSPKSKSLRFDLDTGARKKLLTDQPAEPVKTLPVTVFDFNGSAEYYEHMSPFIDTNAVHLICIQTADFHRLTPRDIEEVFSETFDLTSHPMIKQLFQILELLCEKVTKTNAMMIVPIATCIDLYDQRPKEDKIQVLDRMNQFFKLYLQFRIDRIKRQIEQIRSLLLISPSLSDRLKTFNSLRNINIQIESCQPISSITYQGIPELNHTIEHCISTHKHIFPRVDRILPTLWADTNRSIEFLADHLPVPYLLWEDYTGHVINKYGLSHLINEITTSLHEQGKIFVINEFSTTNRVVILQPLWLGDLLSSLVHQHHPSETNDQYHRKEYYQFGRLHSDLLRSLWSNLLHKKEYFFHLWIVLMRFLLVAYPKVNKRQLEKLLHSKELHMIKFDYAIVPHYLPFVHSNERDEEKRHFSEQMKHRVSICYRSLMLPLGLFHRYSVSSIWKLDLTYLKHWNDFILGKHVDKQVKFMMETDHQTYISCVCGTSADEEPFDRIWSVLMLMINHLEEMFTVLAPNKQFDRFVQCPFCYEFSFMGEWATPKELQGLKQKSCSSCGENVETHYLVQPNETKRRNEELLKKIRERKANKSSIEATSPSTNKTHFLVSSA